MLEAPHEIKHRFQKFCDELENVSTEASTYNNFQTLIKARARSPFSPLSLKSSEILMQRGTQKSGRIWKLRSDPRLRLPSSFRLSVGQAEALLAGLHCPTLILRNKEHKAHDYWRDYEPTLSSCKNLKLVDIKGGHHLHMENVQETSLHIQDFLGSHVGSHA